MPIAYSAEKQGWYLSDPTPEEKEQIEIIGTKALIDQISLIAAQRAMKQFQEDQNQLASVPTEQMGQA
jgi:hypothetical protein